MTCHSSHVGAGFPNRLVTYKSSSLELGIHAKLITGTKLLSRKKQRATCPRSMCSSASEVHLSRYPKKSSLPEVPRLFLLLCFAARSHLERTFVLTRYVCGGCSFALFL